MDELGRSKIKATYGDVEDGWLTLCRLHDKLPQLLLIEEDR